MNQSGQPRNRKHPSGEYGYHIGRTGFTLSPEKTARPAPDWITLDVIGDQSTVTK